MHARTHTREEDGRAGSRALKLSLYFIGRAYKSKASANQILEALHTPIHAGDVQNADTCLSVFPCIPDWPASSHKYKHASYR